MAVPERPAAARITPASVVKKSLRSCMESPCVTRPWYPEHGWPLTPLLHFRGFAPRFCTFSRRTVPFPLPRSHLAATCRVGATHDQYRRTQLAVLGEYLPDLVRGRPRLHARPQVQPRVRPDLPVGRAGAGAVAADAALARPGRGTRHRRLHLRLPR